MKKIIAIITAVLMFTGIFGMVISNASVKYDSLDDYGDASNSAIQRIKGDDQDLFVDGQGEHSNIQDFLLFNENTLHGPFSTVSIKGYFCVNLDILEFGYAIGENDPVFIEDCFSTDFPEWALQGGLKYVKGYDMTIDVSGLGEEKTLIKPVAKLEDGTVVEATFLSIYYSSKPAEEKAEPVIVELTAGSGGPAYNFAGNQSIGFRFRIPEGMRLVQFTILGSPTWNGPATGVGLTANIYRWTNEDFDESMETESLGEYFEEDHKDNANLNIEFDTPITAGDYLIVLTDFTGNIGGWGPGSPGVSEDQKGIFQFFVNGMDSDPLVKCRMTIIEYREPDPTVVPATEEPKATDEPVKTEEPAATEVPATQVPATDAPKVTDEPAKTDDAPKNSTGLIIGIIAGIVVVAGVIAGVVISKKRKK